MIEQTEAKADGAILVSRAVAPGQNIAFAGSDIASGQTLLHAGTAIGAREIGMMAAVGIAEAPVWRRRARRGPLDGRRADAAGTEAGASSDLRFQRTDHRRRPRGERLRGDPPRRNPGRRGKAESARSARPTRIATRSSFRAARSKGAGDLTHRIVARLGRPGIVTHGVALKPGKPLCLAVCDGKPVIVLPGFPTSAMFTFHDIVAPALRTMAGLPARQETTIRARVPVRVPSDLGRTEFVMAALAQDADGYVAHPVGKGSGAVTAFSQADGFFAIEALADAMPSGATVEVTLFSAHVRVPDLVVMGSHCTGLDAVASALSRHGLTSRILALGSQGGLAALERGECDVAPIHLLDPATGAYNQPFLGENLSMIRGWRRRQGLVFRRGDARFEGRNLEQAVSAALADNACLMVNRNAGAGTRTLIDRLLKGAKPPGYWNQPRSHNAVAAAIAQGRADWGVAIRPVAETLGLGFIPSPTRNMISRCGQASPKAPRAWLSLRPSPPRAKP